MKCKNQHYNQKSSPVFWDQYSSWYEKWIEQNYFHHKVMQEIRKHLNRNQSILDIGGGSGVLALPLAEKVQNVTVIEPSSKMLDKLEDKISGRGLENIRYIQQPWEEVDEGMLAEHDLAIICNSIYWTDDLHYFLEKASGVCRQGIIVVVNIPNTRSKRAEIYRRLKGEEQENGDKIGLSDLINYAKTCGSSIDTTILEFTSRCCYPNLEEAVEHWRILLDMGTEEADEITRVMKEYLQPHKNGYVFRERSESAVVFIGTTPKH